MTPFLISRYTRSETAERQPGLKYEQENPPAAVIDNLVRLHNTIIAPIEECFFIRIGSGYRCEPVNKMVGGSLTSAHLFGRAADIEPVEETLQRYQELCRWITENKIPFDKMILEYGAKEVEGIPAWIHLQVNKIPGKSRRLVYRICSDTKQDYIMFDVGKWALC